MVFNNKVIICWGFITGRNLQSNPITISLPITYTSHAFVLSQQLQEIIREGYTNSQTIIREGYTNSQTITSYSKTNFILRTEFSETRNLVWLSIGY